MKIIVISDTHGSCAALKKLDPFLKDADMLVHCGDILYHGPRNYFPEEYGPENVISILSNLSFPVIAVQGNCDSDIDRTTCPFPIVSSFFFFMIDSRRFFATHGNLYTQEEIKDISRRWNVNVVLSGHTHCASLHSSNGQIFLNPGSLALPKNFPGVGIIEDHSVSLYNLAEGILSDSLPLP